MKAETQARAAANGIRPRQLEKCEKKIRSFSNPGRWTWDVPASGSTCGTFSVVSGSGF